MSLPPVVFVHGLYVAATCWDAWRARFEARGYTTHAPEWPGHAGDPAALRAAPPAELSSLTFEDVVALHRDLIATLPEPPLLVGHSMGGLIVQLLLQEGLGRAGVAIASAPPRGVTVLSWSFLRSNLPSLLGPGSAPIVLTPSQFHYAFANHVDAEASRALYAANLVPESRRVAQGPLSAAATVDWSRERAPLLMMAGGADHIIPAALNRKNAARYDAARAPTTLVEHPGRTHWTLAQEGWEAVADEALAWLAR